MLEKLPIFVYGTLMIGERNYLEILHKNITHYEAASVKGNLYYYQTEDYPALTPGNKEIKGQLFYVDKLEEVFKPLDKIEGYIAPNHPNNMYNRQILEVKTANGEMKKAYAYRINPIHFRKRAHEFTPIYENSWKQFKKQNPFRPLNQNEMLIKSSMG